MNCLEKRHVGHKAQSYLDSFMDETDREVMSLTDRAFKSLCIGDEAIYNDSEFSPSPVSCHKPLAEDKLSQTLKKHGAHPPNGVNDTTWQINKNSSHFSAFVAKKKKNGDATKVTNGDSSWDKSALLSIQKELSEFSSDYQNTVDKQFSQIRNHLKHSEKCKDNLTPSQHNSTKSKHGKSSKLKKLNSKNFFLHSELSPFQSWRDFNKFPFSLENIAMDIDMNIFPNNGSPEWYDSPLYKKLTLSHRLHVSESNKGGKSRNASLPALQDKPEPKESRPAPQILKTVKPERPTELNQPEILTGTQPQVLLTSCSAEQRCQSDGDSSAPWRKNRNRAKSAAPVVQASISSPACDKTKAGEECVYPNKKEIKTMEEQTSSSSTPFSILQLLTPIIPSRQGTGSSEVLQAVLSPSILDLPPLHETEMRPSPEIKREGYKSIASSLLFNLKDNRKRVKTMYSPPKFKGLDSGDQNKLSPLIEQVVTNNCEEITDAKTTSPGPVSPKDLHPKIVHKHNSPASGPTSGVQLDDYLALSLLQAGGSGSPMKSNKSPMANKATYPSLNLYRKASPVEPDTKTMQTPGLPESADKSTKHSIDQMPEKDVKDLEEKHLNKPNDNANCETNLNSAKTKATAGQVRTEKISAATLKEKYPLALSKRPNTRPDALTPSDCKTSDTLSTGETEKVDQSPLKEKECVKKEPKPKHLFSARQNNYIKSQRYVSGGDDEEYDEVSFRERDVVKDNNNDDLKPARISGNTEGKGKRSEDALGSKDVPSNNVLGADKNDVFSMKGNTSAKRALFISKEQVGGKSALSLKKDNVVMDKFELAKMALEEVIAEREQRKKQSQTLSSIDKDDVKRQVGGQDSLRQEHYKQATKSKKDTFESATKDKRRGQRGISDFNLSSQIVQSMSDRETKHGESHVAEVNLARPCKQEGVTECSQHAAGQIKYTERDRSGRRDRQCEPDRVKPKDKVTQQQEKEPEPKNKNLLNDGSRVDTQQTKPGEEGSTVQTKNRGYKPEVPPRRGRANSASEGREVCETERKEDVSKEDKRVKTNLTKDRGPVRGHVSALKEKFHIEQGVQSVQESLTLEEQDKIKQQENMQRSFESEASSTKHKETGINSDKKSERDSRIFVRKEEEPIRKCDRDEKEIEMFKVADKDDKEDVTKNEKECAMKELDDAQSKCKDHDKEIVSDVFGKPEAEDLKPVEELSKRTPEPSTNAKIDIITVYDILKKSEPPSPVNFEQVNQSNLFSDSSKPEGDLTSLVGKCEENVEQLIQNSSISKPKCESSIYDRIISPPSDLEKGGWVHCLIESARNLTPTSPSSVTSPTLGKPVLFKVKDNTFSACPVTKTVRPILHKTSTPWSPRESLSGSERGEEELFKDCVEVHSPIILSPTPPSTPARSPQPNQSSLQFLTSQFTTVRERKGQMDFLAVPEDYEMRSAASSEGIESCGTSTGDTMEETISSIALTEDAEESRAPSERSGSVCSGIENLFQGKPPVVPPKTEKALRRAMKLTTRRIQKAEAKSKSERKGRSSEKEANHKPERRHHSSDKVLSHRSNSIDNQSVGDISNDGEILSKTYEVGKHSNQESHRKEKDVRKHKSHYSNNNDHAKNCTNEKFDEKLELCKVMSLEAPSERLGRTSVKYQAEKLDRRAHSLDRFLRDKPEHKLPNIGDTLNKTKTEVPKIANLRRNSAEHAYPPTANILTQSFPMTQRKLLQDPDSGQYFVVDMPVQVKTKTFFDPETGSYVQLPVQSPEVGLPQAQSMEVMNAPSVVLYHGFVPMPISSLPAQKSTVKVHSIVTPEEMFESHEKGFHSKANGQPYMEPSHEHLLEEGIESVNR